jgi:hypothetical protein
MSQVIREAVDLLQAVVEKIDTRLLELDAERALLLEKRGELVVIIDGHGSARVYRPDAVAPLGSLPTASVAILAKPLEVDHAVGQERPAARPVSSPVPKGVTQTGIRQVDAANRIVKALEKATAPVRFHALLKASELSLTATKRLVAELVQVGRLRAAGVRAGTRYSLPTSGRAQPAAAPADSEGDRGRRRAASRR